MIIVTANIGLLPCPSKGQLHQARRQLHRKRESQHSIEQLAIQVTGNVAVDYYRINATWANGEGAEVRTDRLRITHTWIRTGGTWQIIGGMSSPVNAEGK